MSPAETTVPDWPRYIQSMYSPGPVFLLGIAGAILLFVGKPLWALLPMAVVAWKLTLEPLGCALINWVIRRRWVRRIGRSIGWHGAAKRVADDPGSWIVLAHQVHTGSVSFGTYDVSGGRDDYLLVRRGTLEQYVLRERLHERARSKAEKLALTFSEKSEAVGGSRYAEEAE